MSVWHNNIKLFGHVIDDSAEFWPTFFYESTYCCCLRNTQLLRFVKSIFRIKAKRSCSNMQQLCSCYSETNAVANVRGLTVVQFMCMQDILEKGARITGDMKQFKQTFRDQTTLCIDEKLPTQGKHQKPFSKENSSAAFFFDAKSSRRGSL